MEVLLVVGELKLLFCYCLNWNYVSHNFVYSN